MGHKWVTSGSHPDYSMGQWVKWVNGCDPLSTLMKVLDNFNLLDDLETKFFKNPSLLASLFAAL